jgi:ABC-2 type transport system permease protein
MTTLVAIELDKLRTVRTTWLLVLVQQALVVAAIAGLVAIGATKVSAPSVERQLLSAGAGVLAPLLSLLLGILAMSGEHRHRTITDVYLATPRRERVVAAKLVALCLAGAGLGVTTVGVALAASWVAMAVRHVGLDLGGGETWRAAAGLVAGNALCAAIGVSVGALVRNVAGAVAAALVWIFVGEGILTNLFAALSAWLPNASLMALVYSRGRMAPGATILSQWEGALMLAAYAAVLAGVAVATTVRRDVT